MRVWQLHECDGELQVDTLRNARRLRYCAYLSERGGCFGKEMLDAYTQVGWELQEAHRQVDPKPFGSFFGWVNLRVRNFVKVLSTPIFEDRYSNVVV